MEDRNSENMSSKHPGRRLFSIMSLLLTVFEPNWYTIMLFKSARAAAISSMKACGLRFLTVNTISACVGVYTLWCNYCRTAIVESDWSLSTLWTPASRKSINNATLMACRQESSPRLLKPWGMKYISTVMNVATTYTMSKLAVSVTLLDETVPNTVLFRW